MRVTVTHREEPTYLGRKSFYVDVTVLFSEREKAVIRQKQLGRHHLEVGSDIPTCSGIDFFGYGAWGLRILSRIGFVGFWILLIPSTAGVLNVGWGYAALMLAVIPFAYRKYAEHTYDKSIAFRYIYLKDLVHDPNFTVYAPDAFQAKQAEAAILAGLEEVKRRLVIAAPELNAPQVYS